MECSCAIAMSQLPHIHSIEARIDGIETLLGASVSVASERQMLGMLTASPGAFFVGYLFR